MSESISPKEQQIPGWRLAGFASIAFPTAGMTLPLAIFLPPFYTKTLGLGLAEVGLVFMLVHMQVVKCPQSFDLCLLFAVLGAAFVSQRSTK